MSKEIERSGEVMTIGFLAEILDKGDASLILRISDSLGQPVSYNELREELNSKYAIREKKPPSQGKVKGQLGFLVRKKLLAFEEAEGRYKITPLGAQAVRDLFPRRETGSVRA